MFVQGLITGIMAAGKSTVAQRLAETLPRCVHLRGDVFRRMIVSGQAEIGFDLSEEARAQLSLRYRIAATVAEMYLDAGFTVVYQDIILGPDLREAVERLRHHPLSVVVLCPTVEAVTAREAGRGKIGYGDLSIAAFDEALHTHTSRIGYWLDSTELTAEQTVATILTHWKDAEITV
jgi:predicted kinase